MAVRFSPGTGNGVYPIRRIASSMLRHCSSVLPFFMMTNMIESS
jgi:hypothetical protein